MKRTKWLFAAAGIVLLLWVVQKIGIQEILASLSLLGWRILIPILVFAPSYLFYTLAWRPLLTRSGNPVSFWKLLRIKMTGEAANTVTPINWAGGDSLRVWLLRNDVPATVGGASAVIDRTLQIFATLLMIVVGTIAALVQLPLPPKIAWSLTGTVALMLALTFLFLSLQSRGLFEKLSGVLMKLKIRKLSDGTLEKLKEVDQQVGGFYRRNPGPFWKGIGYHFIARLFGVLEIYVIGFLLQVPITGWDALFLATIIPIANLFSTLVPGAWGVQEGVVSGLFYLLHWNPADGIALQMARRLRSGFWISVGFLFFLSYRSKKVAT